MFNPKINKVSHIIIFIFIWSLASISGIYFRLYPLTHYATDDSTEKATLIVISNIRKTAVNEIEQTYPQASPLEKKQLAQQRFGQMLKKEGQSIRGLINRLAREMDSQMNHRGKPWLLEADPFYFYQLTENIVKTGQLGEGLKGSKYFNKLMLAPLGAWGPFTLHPYVGFLVYKIIHFFNPQTSLMNAVSFVPLILFSLSLIPLLLICYRTLNCSAWAILAGAFTFSLASAYLKRSMFGWYDNDPYNTLFPLLILFILFEALAYPVSSRRLFLLGLTNCLLVTAYALFWQGWVFIESILIISALLIIPYNHFWLKSHEQTRNLLIYFSGILGGTLLGITLAFGPKEFFILFHEGWIALTDFVVRKLTLWPDMYLAVGELRGTTFKELVELTDSPLVFTVSLLGFLATVKVLFQRNVANNAIRYRYLPLAAYFVISFVMTLKAQRFAFLYLVPASILFVLGWQQVLSWAQKALKTVWPKDQHHWIRFQVVCACLTGAIILVSFKQADFKTEGLVTAIYNDTWDQIMTAIREKTPEDSIVNSWWPPGHFVKAMAYRRVTFDGATINSSQAYWMAQVFLSGNERQALGMLRMLNNSANEASEYLYKSGMPLSQAVDLLKSITALNRDQAARRLKATLRPEQIDRVLNMTHRLPPPSYLLVYNDLVEKNILISFTGNWNFKKVEEFNQNPRLLEQLPANGSKNYVQFLWSLAGKQPRYSDRLGLIGRQGSQLLFENNVVVDLQTKNCIINSSLFGKGVPANIFYLDETGQLMEKKFANATLSYSVAFVQHGTDYSCVLMEDSTARSLLIRLFFFGGSGFKYIEPFAQASDLTRRTEIYVYRVNWEKFLQDLGDTKN